jgi:hypothetical protein
LPPVAIAPIYQQPKDGQGDAQLGYDLWHNCFRYVIELTTVYRFIKDKDYGDLLQRLRDGEVTLKDIEILNNRHVSLLKLPKDVQIIVYDNNDRSALIHGLTEAYLSFLSPIDKESAQPWKTINHLRVMATFEKDKLRITDSEQLDAFYSYDSINAEAKLCPILDLYVGMGVIIITNKAVGPQAIMKKRIGNGTRAKIVSIHLKPSAEPKPITLMNVETYAVFASEISFLVMEHVDPDLKQATNIEGLPPGCFPLRPLSTTFTPKGLSKSCGFRATQLPMIPSIVATGHKVQGQTITSACIGGFTSKRNIPNNWFYVVLSRVTTLKGLYLLEKLPTDLRKYKVPQAVLDEEKRLEKYKQASLLRLKGDHSTVKGKFFCTSNLTIQALLASPPRTITVPPPTTFRTIDKPLLVSKPPYNPRAFVPKYKPDMPPPSMVYKFSYPVQRPTPTPSKKKPPPKTVIDLDTISDAPSNPIKAIIKPKDTDRIRSFGRKYAFTPWFVNNGAVCHLSAFLAAMDAMIRNSGLSLLKDKPENDNRTMFGEICNQLIQYPNAYDLHDNLVEDLCSAEQWTSLDPWEDVLNVLRISYHSSSLVSTSLQYALRETICGLYPRIMYGCRYPYTASLGTWIELFDDSTLSNAFTKWIYEYDNDVCPTHGRPTISTRLMRGFFDLIFTEGLTTLANYLLHAVTQMLTVKTKCASCDHGSERVAQLVQTPTFLMLNVEILFHDLRGHRFVSDTNFWRVDEILTVADARYKCVAVGWIRPGHFVTTVRINDTWFLRDCLKPETTDPLTSFAPPRDEHQYTPHSFYYVKIQNK